MIVKPPGRLGSGGFPFDNSQTRTMPLPIVFAQRYDLDLDPTHRFPAAKFRRIGELIVEEGLADEASLIRPGPAPLSWISGAHDLAYVEQVASANVPDKIAREIGYRMTEAVALRSRTASAGTVLTARLALEQGLASNAAGGSHHARRSQGAGFCVFNDVAVAIRLLQSEGAIERALIVDLDVHQGDGTADIFAGNPEIFTFSMHGERNYRCGRSPATSISVCLMKRMTPPISRCSQTFCPVSSPTTGRISSFSMRASTRIMMTGLAGSP